MPLSPRSAVTACMLIAALALPQLGTPGAIAQEARPTAPHADHVKSGAEHDKAANKVDASPARAELNSLPADVTTHHSLALPGRTLAFTATAGSIRLYNGKGEPQADIAVTAYKLDGADPRTRPVTFLFNGGPGASSAWLQLGAAGPWRLPIGDSVVASSPPVLQANAETWLDFTDLVFIDPVGTGYSRFAASGDEVRKHFYSVDGDVSAMAVVIRRWLEKNDRLTSPKYLAGESYGGIRGPKVADNLQTKQGIGVNGLILVSPVLDFHDLSGSSLLQYAARLPSMAAVARQQKGKVTRADLADVESYARSEFLTDLVKGENDKEATTRLSDRVAALTGIDKTVSRRLAGRFDTREFQREFDREHGRVTGRFDGAKLGLDPFPDSSSSHFGDPSADSLIAPLTSAAVQLTRSKLNWKPDGSYELLNGSVAEQWDFGRGRHPLESTTQLREILSVDPTLQVLVSGGLFDLAAPYYGTQIVLDQLPPTLTDKRVKFVVYPGGHMFYADDASRQALRDEVKAMMK
ncbi:peptidase S10 [Rhodopseudomonas palustris]|uniref:Peptidase S10 n=1 Tax=Rhodopseudomonas palustris TaxID=1076 RepID=A0A323UFD9_RHOPL|nr:peptidase S10 [Rhodopseudomonas palustris]PZA11575.1 peptidase S10 [Rhodopseudomonas palustris]